MSRTLYVTKTYKQRIKQNHPLYKTFIDLTVKSKNLYNLALYTERQFYFENHKIIPRFTLQTLLTGSEAFKQLTSKTSQMITHQAYQAMHSFNKSIKEFNRNPSKFLGRPKLPKYKDKVNGRNQVTFDYQQLRQTKQNTILLPKKLGEIKIPNYLLQKKIIVKPSNSNYDIKYNPKTELIQLRIVPKFHELSLEFIYNEEIELQTPQNKQTTVASIDLGLDNFVAMIFYKPYTTPILINGKGLKSYNQYFNKTIAHLKSQSMKQGCRTTKRIQSLYLKRDRYIQTWMHKASRFIVNECIKNEVTILVIGRNKFQKQSINLGHKTNQKFVQIPYHTFINQLRYKCYESGIKFIETEESYTSGTSFLDNEQPTSANYNTSRRIHRGLFKSNTNQRINADINSAFQILKKVYPVARYQPQLSLQPIKINVS